MSGLCALALISGLTWSLPVDRMTLSWEHSVEKIEWRETWGMERDGLHLLEARVQGSGAGMEPGPGAQFKDGWWVWQPIPSIVVPSIHLTRSGFVGDYVICVMGNCRPLGIWFPGLYQREDLELRSC